MVSYKFMKFKKKKNNKYRYLCYIMPYYCINILKKTNHKEKNMNLMHIGGL